MLTLNRGRLRIGRGRFRTKSIFVGERARLTIDGEAYTTTTVSYGTIDGAGTLRAWWVTSEFIGGVILDQFHEPTGPLTTVYYGERPVAASWVQIMSGCIVVTTPQWQWSFKD